MKYFFLFILLFLTLTVGISQNSQPGFLITVDGDTVSGQIRAVNWKNDPDRINHFILTGPDGSEKTWEAKDIVQYAIGQSSYADHQNFYAKVWPHNGLQTFLEPRVDGNAQLFVVPDPEKFMGVQPANRIVFDPKFRDPKDDAYYISSAGSKLIIRAKQENYDLVLKQVLKDCPELTEQIGQKKFKFRNLEKIITFYNESCK